MSRWSSARRAWHRIRHSLWTGLFIIAASTVVRGVFYLPGVVEPYDVPAMEQLAPMDVWAAVWITIGLFGCVAAVARRFGATAISLVLSLHGLQAVLYIASWIQGESPRGYVSALTYLLVVVFVLWAFSRGRSTEVRVDQYRGV